MKWYHRVGDYESILARVSSRLQAPDRPQPRAQRPEPAAHVRAAAPAENGRAGVGQRAVPSLALITILNPDQGIIL